MCPILLCTFEQNIETKFWLFKAWFQLNISLLNHFDYDGGYVAVLSNQLFGSLVLTADGYGKLLVQRPFFCYVGLIERMIEFLLKIQRYLVQFVVFCCLSIRSLTALRHCSQFPNLKSNIL